MAPEIIIAILSLCGTAIGSIAGIMTANHLTVYRIDILEKKVERHNNVVERFVILENDETSQWKRIDELKADMEAIKKEVYSHEQ